MIFCGPRRVNIPQSLLSLNGLMNQVCQQTANRKQEQSLYS
uniref:Uncharacterized protein n=1 Tax=Anguilla anguilla TaxID=7936 RepID=A0A0E9U6F4_ANGAN